MSIKTCTTSTSFYVQKPSPVAGFTDVNKAGQRQKEKSKIDLYRNLFRFAEAHAQAPPQSGKSALTN